MGKAASSSRPSSIALSISGRITRGSGEKCSSLLATANTCPAFCRVGVRVVSSAKSTWLVKNGVAPTLRTVSWRSAGSRAAREPQGRGAGPAGQRPRAQQHHGQQGGQLERPVPQRKFQQAVHADEGQ